MRWRQGALLDNSQFWGAGLGGFFLVFQSFSLIKGPQAFLNTQGKEKSLPPSTEERPPGSNHDICERPVGESNSSSGGDCGVLLEAKKSRTVHMGRGPLLSGKVMQSRATLMDRASSSPSSGQQGGISEYERQRLQRIARNRVELERLGFYKARATISAAAGASSSNAPLWAEGGESDGRKKTTRKKYKRKDWSIDDLVVGSRASTRSVHCRPVSYSETETFARLMRPDDTAGKAAATTSGSNSALSRSPSSLTPVAERKRKSEILEIKSADVAHHLNSRTYFSSSSVDRVTRAGFELRYVNDQPYNRGGPKPVLEVDQDGNVLREFSSACEAGRKHGLSNGKVGQICNGCASGNGLYFKWKYQMFLSCDVCGRRECESPPGAAASDAVGGDSGGGGGESEKARGRGRGRERDSSGVGAVGATAPPLRPRNKKKKGIFLMCDGQARCGSGAHAECLELGGAPLGGDGVPLGDWYCAACDREIFVEPPPASASAKVGMVVEDAEDGSAWFASALYFKSDARGRSWRFALVRTDDGTADESEMAAKELLGAGPDGCVAALRDSSSSSSSSLSSSSSSSSSFSGPASASLPVEMYRWRAATAAEKAACAVCPLAPGSKRFRYNRGGGGGGGEGRKTEASKRRRTSVRGGAVTRTSEATGGGAGEGSRTAEDLALLQQERARQVASIVCTSGLPNCYCRSGRTKPIERVDARGCVQDTYCSGADAARKLTALLQQRAGLIQALEAPGESSSLATDLATSPSRSPSSSSSSSTSCLPSSRKDSPDSTFTSPVRTFPPSLPLPLASSSLKILRKKVQHCPTGAPDVCNADGTTEPFPYLVWAARRAAVKRYRFLQRNRHPVDHASNKKKKQKKKKKKKLARVSRAIGGDGKSTCRKRKRAEGKNEGGDHDSGDDDEEEEEEEEEEDEEMHTVWVDAKPEDHNTDACCVCNGVGDLLCCDFCPRAFHLKCIGVKEDDLPDGAWQCHGCDADEELWATERLLQHPLLEQTTERLEKRGGGGNYQREKNHGQKNGAQSHPPPSHRARSRPGAVGKDEGEPSPATAALQKATELLELLARHDFAGPFLTPLDPQALGLARYDDIVERRMDLGTVRMRLAAALPTAPASGAYASPSPRAECSSSSRASSGSGGGGGGGGYYSIVDFVKDVRTIWHNCIIYNAQGSAIVRQASSLSAMFEASLKLQFIGCAGLLERGEVVEIKRHKEALRRRAIEIRRFWGRRQ